MTEPWQMIPCTKSVLQRMTVRVMEIMCEHGLIEVGADAEELADQTMQVLKSHGHMDAAGNVRLGRCVLLTHHESSFSLLCASSCPADEYDADLRRKSSPVRFERTVRGEIKLPARWLLTKFEELGENPAASLALQTLALQLSRRAECQDFMVLPHEVETVALTVANADGTETVIEALPGGSVLELNIEVPKGR
jgi:hypothetical protein